jgi:hypothetical protein
MWWINSLGGVGGTFPATRGWNISVPLFRGTNVISICGTNTWGEIASDVCWCYEEGGFGCFCCTVCRN